MDLKKIILLLCFIFTSSLFASDMLLEYKHALSAYKAKDFKTFIEKNVDYVGDEEEKFKVFCTFFEAVVAYAKGNIKD